MIEQDYEQEGWCVSQEDAEYRSVMFSDAKSTPKQDSGFRNYNI